MPWNRWPHHRGIRGHMFMESMATCAWNTHIILPLLAIRTEALRQAAALTKELVRQVKSSDACRRLMTVPGVGTVTAATCVATIDAPGRFTKSRSVGAYAGLTSRRHQSGAVDYGGRISKRGNRLLRTMLYEASKCVGLTGSMLTYAINIGIIEHNVAHGIRKPKDQVRDRRLSDDEYRELGKMLREAGEDHELAPTIAITRLLALTGCRRGEILGLKWSEVDFENSCLRLADSKEGASTRPIGLPVIELLEDRRKTVSGDYVFPGTRASQTFGSFPNHWNKIFGGPRIPDFTAHILRHSFASTANDLGFTESTIAALVGHSTGSITSKYIHSVDSVLIMAADTIAGYIQGLLDGVEFRHTAYALDRAARREALSRFIAQSSA